MMQGYIGDSEGWGLGKGLRKQALLPQFGCLKYTDFVNLILFFTYTDRQYIIINIIIFIRTRSTQNEQIIQKIDGTVQQYSK